MINAFLDPILAEVKNTGEVPKPKDKRFQEGALKLGIAPFSLQYHLRTCLIDREIHDQMMVEVKDLIEAVASAKSEYSDKPHLQNAQAVSVLMNTLLSVLSKLEGEQSPEQAIEFIVDQALGHIIRACLADFAKETRDNLALVTPHIPPATRKAVRDQMEASLKRVSITLANASDEAVANLCKFYKVELDAADKKQTLSAITAVPPDKNVQ